MYMEKNRLDIGRGGNHLFECPMCLEETVEFHQVFIADAYYSVCPFCYHVINTLRKKKKNFEVEIQKW